MTAGAKEEYGRVSRYWMDCEIIKNRGKKGARLELLIFLNIFCQTTLSLRDIAPITTSDSYDAGGNCWQDGMICELCMVHQKFSDN